LIKRPPWSFHTKSGREEIGQPTSPFAIRYPQLPLEYLTPMKVEESWVRSEVDPVGQPEHPVRVE
jgi:hypothetical protein